MKREEIERAVYEVLIDVIAERVKERLNRQEGRILVVFTGAALGFSVALEQLKDLKNKGFIIYCLFSDMALGVLNITKVREYLGEDLVIINKSKNPEMMVDEFDAIVVPTMTINTMAKVSRGITDTPAARVIFSALMRGKTAIIAIDGCCPDNKAREELGYKINSALKEELRENMRRVSSYGAKLTVAEKLYSSVIKKAQGSSLKNDGMSSLNKNEKNEIYIDKRVIGYQDIMSNKNYRIIKINKESLLTAMAEEAIKNCSLELRRVKTKE